MREKQAPELCFSAGTADFPDDEKGGRRRKKATDTKLNQQSPSERNRTQLQCRPLPAAPRGKCNKSSVASSPRSASDPRTHSVLSCHPYPRKRIKKGENRLEFPVTRCKLLFGNGLLSLENRFLSSFHRLFQQKTSVNRPSFKNCFLLSNRNNSAKTHCVFVSCWASLCRFESRFLVGPTDVRTGKRPAFFNFK